MIPFNKPYMTGDELYYIKDAVLRGKISGNGYYTQKCHNFFKEVIGFRNCLLTSSCTDALEMAGILIDIKPGDEVIMPSYTFVSTANAFVLRGAKIVFADSYSDNPNIDANLIEGLITSKTKAIVVVHYAGVACDMDTIMDIANNHKLFVIEDAAQAIDSYYKGRPLGTIGHLGTFSFHETKNIISGEGGMLVINDERFDKRAEIIWEKGTNRSAFFRGEVDKYSWVDVGSSFLPSDVTAAFLFAQLENLKKIQSRRKTLWNQYYEGLKKLENEGLFELPSIPAYASCNGHLFYILCKHVEERSRLITHLKENGVYAVFHYVSLHKSPFYELENDNLELDNCEMFSERLLRLPLYYELHMEDQNKIINLVISFFDEK
ncbi:dTDP-4-amino-4,6-dideoxygalactose transaminase [Aquimarina sp. BL5]|uniref:dTDP-4-amino-4,6-dideoxygalactose transaminase n=1 Tax=Aquimarina sp. BL5 TaxID=1714860 RepID=UPI000E500C3E|nr:dTDP-4-amino-4,6-dideoxygalactose transaminase [Aquimarina sp. BL5]AXT50975.1 dTDP-4-amino-4,6-dideoxygalactose transaminase [Aquimarina sp. BL5]RKM97013.1 dTDP-4-amino-4,6-dideoxygalactose transaminase [Aquimarina sp. BL5]